MEKLLNDIRRPDISFNRNGDISITSRVVRMLNISPGDSINIGHDNNEYFLYVVRVSENSNAKLCARCCPSKKKGLNFRARSVTLSRNLLDRIGVVSQKASFFVGSLTCINEVDCLPIITLHPIIHK